MLSAFADGNGTTERGKNRLDDARSIQPRRFVHHFGLAVIDKGVRENFRAHAQSALEQAFVRQELQHVAAETADRALFDRD